ncbi:MAG: hypothetical protein P8Y34_08845, partial [Anaerolineales bacterium]
RDANHSRLISIHPPTLLTGVSPAHLFACSFQFAAPKGFSDWRFWPGFHHFRVRWQTLPTLLVFIAAFHNNVG